MAIITTSAACWTCTFRKAAVHFGAERPGDLAFVRDTQLEDWTNQTGTGLFGYACRLSGIGIILYNVSSNTTLLKQPLFFSQILFLLRTLSVPCRTSALHHGSYCSTLTHSLALPTVPRYHGARHTQP